MQIISLFREVLEPDELILDDIKMATYTIDWRKRYQASCHCVLRPKSLGSLQKIMQIAYDNCITVTPQGGNTSMCGASIPSIENSVIVILERISKIRSLNTLDRTVTAEAGIVLANLRSFVREAGFYFPLSLASESSCQIGGTIACNAGGLNVLRYGTMRDLVLGLEVILPNGHLISHLSGLHKNTTGLDTKQLWIGSEGTLGIITAATLKIYPQVNERMTFLIACDEISQVLFLLQKFQFEYMSELTSFEYMSLPVFQLSQNYSGICFGLSGQHFVLCELSFDDKKRFDKDLLLEQLLLLGFSNTIVACSDKESQRMWQVRENISEAQKNTLGISIKHDIAVPISSLQRFIENTEMKVKSEFPDATILLFGHLGDGSLHYNVSLARDRTNGVYQFEEQLNRLVYTEVIKHSGTIAAEHGIGQLKKKWLSLVRTEQEIQIMSALKKAIDPKNIMNPGKIIPD
ncbi:MAG: FAD-binding protein [Neisseriaceae bacterium]|nr:MAG: FAD-binding protein [Neisseriaceae bacterium]